MRMGPHHMMPRDTDAVRDVTLAEGTSRRVWAFARPYQTTIAVFLAVRRADGTDPVFATGMRVARAGIGIRGGE